MHWHPTAALRNAKQKIQGIPFEGFISDPLPFFRVVLRGTDVLISVLRIAALPRTGRRICHVVTSK